MSRWTLATWDVQCGHASGRHVIPAGQPVYLGAGTICRCTDHAPCPVDEQQLDAVRHAREAAAAAETAPRVPRPPTFHRPSRPGLPFAKVQQLLDGFDPRAAQFRDND